MLFSRCFLTCSGTELEKGHAIQYICKSRTILLNKETEKSHLCTFIFKKAPILQHGISTNPSRERAAPSPSGSHPGLVPDHPPPIREKRGKARRGARKKSRKRKEKDKVIPHEPFEKGLSSLQDMNSLFKQFHN